MSASILPKGKKHLEIYLNAKGNVVMKKIAIRILSLMLSAIMLACALASCGAGDAYAPNNKGEGGFMDSMSGGAPSPEGSLDNSEPGEAPDNDEDYAEIVENDFMNVLENPLATLSADVDTASYSNIRRMITSGYKLSDIPKNAVRTEEMLNYFKYDYKLPDENEPFGVSVTISECPWNPENKLAIFGFKTEEIDYSQNDKPSNLVFLIDVSGSMMSSNKLPLFKEVFASFVENLTEKDRISIVTYSGKEKVVLQGCTGDKKNEIIAAVNELTASGSTNGQSGLQKAYSLAKDYFIEGGNNRIIMASDGDLNVGISSPEELKNFVAQKRNEGIYLSVLGFGTGNYRDDNMEALADNGNGNYFYIDSVEEGQKVLGTDLNATINTVANDVKFQIDFNHEYVESYSLIGYENRVLNTEDFEDDKKDAGEVGSGHCLTVAFELKMVENEEEKKSEEWLTVCVRYKEPGEAESKLLEYPITASSYTATPSDDYYFAASIIEFAMVLRESKYCNGTDLNTVLSLLSDIQFKDDYRAEFKELVELLMAQSGISSGSSGGSRYQ